MVNYFLFGGSFFAGHADVAEWQTQQTQNLPGSRSCGFKSRHPQYIKLKKPIAKSSRLFRFPHAIPYQSFGNRNVYHRTFQNIINDMQKEVLYAATPDFPGL